MGYRLFLLGILGKLLADFRDISDNLAVSPGDPTVSG